MYVIVVGVTLVLRFERRTRRMALDRERAAQRERIELSQEIHDSTAQTLYLIRIGIEGALRRARESGSRSLAERLGATLTLSKSALWEIRRPIDMRHIVRGNGVQAHSRIAHRDIFRGNLSPSRLHSVRR